MQKCKKNCRAFASTWGHLRVFGGFHVAHVAHLFSLLYLFLFCFVNLLPVCCVLNVASVS